MKKEIKITVMEPDVENVSSENVSQGEIKPISSELTESEQSAVDARADAQYRFEKLRSSLGIPKSMLGKEGLESDIKFTPVTKESYDGGKKSFLYDDELGQMQAPEVTKKWDANKKFITNHNPDEIEDDERVIEHFGDFDNREDGK